MKKYVISAVFATLATMGWAQTESMQSFRHVGIGLEAGLMGAGAQLSIPVVSDHLVLVVGYNYLEYNIDKTLDDFGIGNLNNDIDNLNRQVNDYNTYVGPFTGKNYSNISRLGSDDITVDASLELNLSNFKCLLEYYPSAHSSFHFTFGAMFGKDYMLRIKGVADPVSNATYQSAMKLNGEIKDAPFDDPVKKTMYDITGVDDLDKVLRLSLDKKTYHLGADASIDARLAINKVRPYLGLGFGRAVPNRRVGFQFEVGTWMHGNPTLKSKNELGYYDESATSNETIDDVYKIVNSVRFWPQMTFRLTGRIF